MNYNEGLALATSLVEAFSPYCVSGHCRIAGSIRRKKPTDIKDAEIVAIPQRITVPPEQGGLFATVGERKNLLYEVAGVPNAYSLSRFAATPDDTAKGIYGRPAGPVVRWIKRGQLRQSTNPNAKAYVADPTKSDFNEDGTPKAYAVGPNDLYWRGWLAEPAPGVKLDFFFANKFNFGFIYFLRTGSMEFNIALMTCSLQRGRPFVDGFLTDGHGRHIITREEEDVFRLVGVRYVPPEQRNSGDVFWRNVLPIELRSNHYELVPEGADDAI